MDSLEETRVNSLTQTSTESFTTTMRKRALWIAILQWAIRLDLRSTFTPTLHAYQLYKLASRQERKKKRKTLQISLQLNSFFPPLSFGVVLKRSRLRYCYCFCSLPTSTHNGHQGICQTIYITFPFLALHSHFPLFFRV